MPLCKSLRNSFSCSLKRVNETSSDDGETRDSPSKSSSNNMRMADENQRKRNEINDLRSSKFRSENSLEKLRLRDRIKSSLRLNKSVDRKLNENSCDKKVSIEELKIDKKSENQKSSNENVRKKSLLSYFLPKNFLAGKFYYLKRSKLKKNFVNFEILTF